MTDETPAPETPSETTPNAPSPTPSSDGPIAEPSAPPTPEDMERMLAAAVGKLGPLADRVGGIVSEVEQGALKDFRALERHLIAYHGLDPNWRQRTPP